jgi:hypothetical protein
MFKVTFSAALAGHKNGRQNEWLKKLRYLGLTLTISAMPDNTTQQRAEILCQVAAGE